MKAKKWTYHTSHSFILKETGQKVSMMSQLYQIGIYIILNGDSNLQANVTPTNMVSQEKKLKKDLQNGKITDLVFGSQITVTTDKDGFYVQAD